MTTAVLVLELLLRYGPSVAQAAQRMLSNGDEKEQADWDALFAKAQKPYDAYIEAAEKRAG
jgi:hypothetical protein